MLCTHTYELSSSSLRQATQIFSMLLVLICCFFFFPQYSEKWGSIQFHIWIHITSYGYTYGYTSVLKSSSHSYTVLSRWEHQCQISQEFLNRTTRDYCRACHILFASWISASEDRSLVCKYQQLIQFFFCPLLYLSDLKVQINKSQQIGRTGVCF